jgi:hypothetical protein
LPFILQISRLCQDGSIRYCPGFEGNPGAERVNAGARYLSYENDSWTLPSPDDFGSSP